MFIAFSGEELGMLGSFHYVNHPAVPLDKTIAMINLDVVGRMENETLVSMGASTSSMLAEMIDKIVKRRNLKLDEMVVGLPGQRSHRHFMQAAFRRYFS